MSPVSVLESCRPCVQDLKASAPFNAIPDALLPPPPHSFDSPSAHPPLTISRQNNKPLHLPSLLPLRQTLTFSRESEESVEMALPATSFFKAGDEVEVRSNEDGFRGAWFEARVVRPVGRNGRYAVDYDALVDEADESRPLRETFDGAQIRPRPPGRAGDSRFVLHQPVDAFHNDAWWAGVVSAVGEGEPRRYTVRFLSGEEGEYGPEQLRDHRDWVDGKWVLTECQSTLEMEFTKGMMVEVSSDDEGFRGAWYTATIVESIGKKFLVEYQNLRTDDETELLKETVDSLHIRPTPPDTSGVEKFKLLEEVDAFSNDGWWVGVISKVLDGSRYMVYFRSWKEEMEFRHQELRPHYDWIDGRWLQASQALNLWS